MSHRWSCLIEENRLGSLYLYCARRMKRCNWKRTGLFFKKLLYFVHWIIYESQYLVIYSCQEFISFWGCKSYAWHFTGSTTKCRVPLSPLIFWFEVKMEATYLSETFYSEINNNKKGVFDSFREIWIIHLYPTSLKPMRT